MVFLPRANHALRADSLMRDLEKRGLYERQSDRNRAWTAREVRVLRRDYGKPGHSLLSIGAALDRTDHEIASKGSSAGMELAAQTSRSVRDTWPCGSGDWAPVSRPKELLAPSTEMSTTHKALLEERRGLQQQAPRHAQGLRRIADDSTILDGELCLIDPRGWRTLSTGSCHEVSEVIRT
jgi:hypothetical protein